MGQPFCVFRGCHGAHMHTGGFRHVVFILFVKGLMHEGHSDRPLAHRRGDPFDIAAPDVTDREHAGQTGFEEMGGPGERPMRGRQILL